MLIKKLKIGKSFGSSKRLANILERAGCGAFGPVRDDNKWQCDDGQQAREFLVGQEYIVLPKLREGESCGEQCYAWLKEWVEGQGKSNIPCTFVLVGFVDTRVRVLAYPFGLFPKIPVGFPIVPPLCLPIHKIRFNEADVTMSLGEKFRASIKYEDLLDIMRDIKVGSSSYAAATMRSRIDIALRRWNYLHNRYSRTGARQGVFITLNTSRPSVGSDGIPTSLWG